MTDIVERLGNVGLWGEAREEILRLRAENSHLHHQTNKLGEDVLRLRAEVAALKKDAERYRWLRSSFRVARWDVKYWTGEFWDVMYGDAMDKQIDAALKESE